MFMQRSSDSQGYDNITNTTYSYTASTNRPNIQIAYQTPISCPKPTLNQVAEADIATTSATIRWTASAANQTLFDIYWSQTNAAPGEATTPSAANQSGTSYTITGLTHSTPYYVWIRGNCGTAGAPDVSGGWTAAVSFATACEAVTIDENHPYTENFDGYSVASSYTAPTTRVLPLCWSAINTTTYNSYQQLPSIYYYSSTNYANSTPNCLKFYSYYSSYSNYDPQPQYAILPEMAHLDDMRIKLQAKGYNATCTFRIGRMTDPTDANTFEPIEIESGVYEQALTTSYQEFTYNLSGVSGDYIAIMIDAANSSRTTSSVYIDDIRVEPIPSCTEPSDLHFISSTTTTAEIGWTAGGSEEKWDIYYSTTNSAPDGSTEPRATVTENPATISGLTHSTTYYVWVRAHCSDNDLSPWVGGITIATACDAITSFPWRENFESYSANTSTSYSSTYKVDAICWVNEHISGSGSSLFQICSSTQTGNSSKKLQLPDMSNGTLTKLRLPEMTLPSDNYQFTIDVLRNTSGNSYTSEGIRVYASTNGEIEGATELGFLYRNCNQTDGGVVVDESTTGWYTYEFPIPFSGTCFIILRGESQYGSATYMDNFIVEQVPTCRKPKNLACDTKTAHTATLSWTNGAAGQTAWQIAYSTNSSFAPANNFTPGEGEGLANVTTNPGTIEGLAASTTYYAYVRANCGGGDYSDWCNAKIQFATLAGNVTPTGLAVNDATITSSSATATWNAVAGNTLHQYYQLYYSMRNTMDPNNLDPDSLITNIATTSYTFNSLTPEKTYYVWVRDYCGTDGYSNWSSATSFTTASDCQTPDGLAKSNVTNNSATISWNTYGQSTFNLRYSTDGANWTTVNSVNSPYTIDGTLDGNTAYQVQVQATCNTEAWSATLNFTTKCDAITAFPVSYGFETSEGFQSGVSATNAPTTNNLGDCWRNQATSNTGSYYARLWCTSTSYYKNGSQSLMLPDKHNNTTLLAFPGMNFSSANGYKLSFWIKREATNSDPEGFKVYVSHTDTIDASAVALGHYSRNYNIAYPQIESTSNWYKYEVYIPQATITGIVYLIFEGQSYYGNSTYLDDVTIEEAPSCYPLGTLTYANVGTHSVELSWPLVDNSQTAWVVEYADNSEFNNFQTASANTHTDFELAGLTPETHYWVRVKADCGNSDYSEVSNVVNFTTGIACHAPSALTASNETTSSMVLSWTNGEIGQNAWVIAYKKEGDANFTEVNVATNPYTLTGLTDGKTYTLKVRANCGVTDGLSQWSGEITHATMASCSAPTNVAAGSVTAHGATITWDGEAPNHNIEYRVVNTADVNETYDLEDGSMPTGWTHIGNGSVSYNSSNAHSTSHSIKFSGTTSDNVLVLPDLGQEINTMTISYWSQAESASQSGEFDMGYVTDPADFSTFHTIHTNSASTDGVSYTKVSNISLSAAPAGARIAFRHRSGQSYYYWFLDDITIAYTAISGYGAWQPVDDATSPHVFDDLNAETIYEVRVIGDCGATTSPYSDVVTFTTLVACNAPTSLTYDDQSLTAHSVDLSWTENNGATAWQVSYDDGTTNETVDIDNDDVTINGTTVTYTLAGLTSATSYTVKVSTNCGGVFNDMSAWSNTIDFTTECEPFTITAGNFINEGFEDYDGATYNNNGVIPTCWLNYTSGSIAPHVIGNGSYYYHHDGTKALTFYGSGNNYAALPELTNNLNDLQISFWMRCESSSNGTLTLGYITASDNGTFNTFTPVPNLTISSSTSMVERGPYYLSGLPANATRLVFRWNCESQYSCCIDDVVVKLAPTCRPVSSVVCDATTAHTATLSWTEYGNATAWQVAYSTDANFDPNSVTPVDVDANPGTIEDLAQSSTYYAYVRANCGGGDYSEWSTTKVTINTIAGNVTPNGLAVNTVTSSTATASWNAVAGNTLHESYDIYWAEADVDEVPATPVAPNLISGITETSYEITGLEASHNYKVWVRDYCGTTDGVSAWSSAVSFTTAAACPQPTNVAANNVTNESATITWDGHGATAFTVSYKADGDADWTPLTDKTSPYNLTGLTGNTTYTVKVKATSCDGGVESAEYEFTTQCDPRTISAVTPFTEGFEGITGEHIYSETGGVYPDCWDSYSEGSVYPHITNSGSYYYVHEGDGTMYFKGEAGTNSYLALPVFTNDLSTLVVNFWMQTENASNGTLSLGYITDADVDYNTYQVIKTYDNNISSMVQRSTYLGNYVIPANAARLVFRWQWTGTSWYGACIDDVEIVLAESFNKTVEANKWYAISSPVNTPEVSGVTNLTSGTYDLFGFTESAGTWNKLTTTFENGRGYIYRRATNATLTFIGAPNANGISYDLSYAGTDNNIKGFNLVGNPYPQTATPGIVCYSLTPSGTWHAELASYNVPICEAVLVKTNGTGNYVSFTPSGAKGVTHTSALAFTVSNEKYEDVAYARFDNGDELPKIGHLEPNAPTLSIPVGDKTYAIANLDSDCESFVMNFSGMGDYTISASGEVSYLHLIDKVTGSDIDLLSQPSYSFKANMGDLSSRFLVKLAPNGKDITDGDFAFRNGNGWTVEGEGILEAYDAMGRRLFAQEISSSSYQLSTSHFPAAGVYILRLGGNSQKIVVTK